MEYKYIDAYKQEEVMAFVMYSILLAKLYTELCTNPSNMRIHEIKTFA